MAPVFPSAAASIIEIREVRFLLNRTRDSSLARDTTVQVAGDADSLKLITVPLQRPDETFDLFLELKDSTGAMVFTGGPVTVSPTTSGEPPVVQVPLQYVGVGANAAGVEITTVPPSLLAGEAAMLVAVALDNGGTVIPGTPIAWRSLDTSGATVPIPDSGRVVARDARGVAPIVAELLTGQADTADLVIQPVPTSIVADSGTNATGTVGETLDDSLVARVVADDSLGVEGVPVAFAVTDGVGTLSADSALTDATGHARRAGVHRISR